MLFFLLALTKGVGEGSLVLLAETRARAVTSTSVTSGCRNRRECCAFANATEYFKPVKSKFLRKFSCCALLKVSISWRPERSVYVCRKGLNESLNVPAKL